MNRRRFLRSSSLLLPVAGGAPLVGLAGCASGGRPPRSTAIEPLAAIEPLESSAQALSALHLLNRLSYGPRPGDVRQVLAMGIERYIAQQLNPSEIALPRALNDELAQLATLSMSTGSLLTQFQAAQRARLQQQAALGGAAGANQDTAANLTGSRDDNAAPRARSIIGAATYDAVRSRLLRAIDSPRQLEELLVDFWFNHFNVFIGKNLDRVLIGHYELHAIRPHVFGRFRDLLGATAKHPAMLFYLDNAQSVAPGFVGRRPGAAQGAGASGLNENYARELMELHTLGADAGYSQSDVTELARILTGWTFDRNDASGDAFRFVPARHDQGEKQWLGRRIEPNGIAEGELALDVLAAHPATARRIGYKLAQFFVADEPPGRLVDTLAQSYSSSQGQIREVLRTLFAASEFRGSAGSPAKFKTPLQFVVSAVRAADISLPANITPLAAAVAQLGMPLFGCTTPDGYKNTEAAWLNPEAMIRRIGFANALASGRLPLNQENPAVLPPAAIARNPNRADPAERRDPADRGADNRARAAAMPAMDWRVVQAAIGPLISAKTRAAIEQSEPTLKAALALGSPDFMRK